MTGDMVPGPPRGRSRQRAADAGGDAAAAEEAATPPARALARLLGDVAWLVVDVAADPRTPARASVVAAGAIALSVMPGAPLLGPRPLARLAVGWLGVRHLLRTAGFAVVFEHWRGSDEELAVVLALAGVKD